MYTIIVKYKGPTNTKSSRFIAKHMLLGKVVTSYDYELNTNLNFLKAAINLCLAKDINVNKIKGFGFIDSMTCGFIIDDGYDLKSGIERILNKEIKS